MTVLAVFDESGKGLGSHESDSHRITQVLAGHGVTFERWEPNQPVDANADTDDLLSAYSDSIERLNAAHSFETVDVVSIGSEDAAAAELRQKFLAEHTHADFEVRFFVAGRGLFCLHLGDRVLALLCEAGDLVSIPADTTHWFDMGSRPEFTCIRFFSTPEGWVGAFTGSDIATRFPDFDAFVASL
ncbi:MAG: cupin [Pseudomonadota bacterium]